MKFVLISGGLGNQMFGYAFCLGLRKRGQNAVLLRTRLSNSTAYNQGFELEKLFQVDNSQGFFSMILSFSFSVFYQILRIFPSKYRPLLLKLVSVKNISVVENFIYYPEVFNFKNRHELYSGTWQSDKFFAGAENEVKRAFFFNTNILSEYSQKMSQQISHRNSVSVHIRRGDYFSNNYSEGFGGICTLEYYFKAVEYISNLCNDAHFYVFTDDKNWVKENFKLGNSFLVTQNTGKESWQDMYLMSQCKHNIIANSSFSWWGAWLNPNPQKIVIAPVKWWSSFDHDDVVPESWIRL